MKKTNISAKPYISTLWRGYYQILINSILLITLLFPAFQTTSSIADENNSKTIHILSPEWPNWTNRDGTGFYFELLQTIYTPYGYTIQTDIATFKRSLFSAEHGDSDLAIGVLPRKGREGKFITPYYPIDSEDFIITSRKEYSWKTFEQLNNIRLMIPRGYSIPKDLPFEFKTVSVKDEFQGLKMLTAKRERYLFGTREMTHENILRIDHNIKEYYMKSVYRRSLYIGFTNTDRGQVLADIYDQRLPILIKNGVLKSLYEKRKLQQQYLLQLPSPWADNN